jgi:hypothetical protein
MAEPIQRGGCVDRQQMLIDKHVSKAGFRGKIDAKCIECIYDPYQPGTWRKQVEDCTALYCPLFSIRPKTTNKGV